jgi:hypothetical protein
MDANVITFPVFVSGSLVQEKSRYLQDKFNIGNEINILLYFGSIHTTRWVDALVQTARHLGDGVILILHGWGLKYYLNHL